MVVRKISEMYDMRTTLNRLGIVGIHTPSWGQIDRRWHGEFLTHKFYRILGCQVRMACASALPPDPLQIGVTGKAIAPQDIMNPILYRAVSNETWNAIIGRLYGTSGVTTDTNSIKTLENALSGLSDAECEQMYYAMLSSNEWRKAMPQAGLSMSGLKPLCYPVYGTFGNGEVVGNLTAGASPVLGSNVQGVDASDNPSSGNLNTDRMLRGRAVRMPRLACSMGGMAYDETDFLVNTPQDVNRTYVGAIVLPPAKLTVFYFRLIVDWFVSFSEPVSMLEKLVGKAQAQDGSFTYNRTYEFTSAKDLAGDQPDGTVSTDGADLDLVMEK